MGSCIQCSVKTCKVAYHVTCAFKRGLEMRAIIEDENADDGVKLRVRRVYVGRRPSFCSVVVERKRRDCDCGLAGMSAIEFLTYPVLYK